MAQPAVNPVNAAEQTTPAADGGHMQNLDPLENPILPDPEAGGTEEDLSEENDVALDSMAIEDLEVGIELIASEDDDPNLTSEVLAAGDDLVPPASVALDPLIDNDPLHPDAPMPRLIAPPALALIPLQPEAPIAPPIAPPPPRPLRGNDFADLELQFNEIILLSSPWKTIGSGVVLFIHNALFISLLTIVPIKLGRLILSALIHLILLTQSVPSLSADTSSSAAENILKYNLQHHDNYLYLTVFRVFENQHYPLPKGALNVTEQLLLDEEMSTFADDPFLDDDHTNDKNGLEDEYNSNMFVSLFGEQPTVDNMTNRLLNLIELSVGNVCLLTLMLLLFSVFVLFQGRLNTVTEWSQQMFSARQMAEFRKGLKVGHIMAIELGVVPIFIGWLILVVILHIFPVEKIEWTNSPLLKIVQIFASFCLGSLFSAHVSVIVNELRQIIRFQFLPRVLTDPNADNWLEFRANMSLKLFIEMILVKLSFAIPSVVLMLLIPFHFGHLLFGSEMYYLKLGSVAPATVQVPLELVLTHFFLPTMLRKYDHVEAMKIYLFAALICSCDMVGIRSYLLNDDVVEEFLYRFSLPQPIVNRNIVHVPFEGGGVVPVPNPPQPPMAAEVIENGGGGLGVAAVAGVIDDSTESESERVQTDPAVTFGLRELVPESATESHQAPVTAAESAINTPEPESELARAIQTEAASIIENTNLQETVPLTSNAEPTEQGPGIINTEPTEQGPEIINTEPTEQGPEINNAGLATGALRPNYLFLKCLWVATCLCMATSLVFSLALHLPLQVGEYLIKLLRSVRLSDSLTISHYLCLTHSLCLSLSLPLSLSLYLACRQAMTTIPSPSALRSWQRLFSQFLISQKN
jgi:hypothetical protein